MAEEKVLVYCTYSTHRTRETNNNPTSNKATKSAFEMPFLSKEKRRQYQQDYYIKVKEQKEEEENATREYERNRKRQQRAKKKMTSPSNPFANVQLTGPQSTPNHASNNINAFGVLTSSNANNLINDTVENNGTTYCREARSSRQLKKT
jgi:alpha-galactosidase/6-phospho-beta-glucosidase family protein